MSNKRLVVIVVFVLSGCGGRSNAGADARDAALGMDVASDEKVASADASHPADFPRSIYFGRSLGPVINQLVLSRAPPRIVGEGQYRRTTPYLGCRSRAVGGVRRRRRRR